MKKSSPQQHHLDELIVTLRMDILHTNLVSEISFKQYRQGNVLKPTEQTESRKLA